MFDKIFNWRIFWSVKHEKMETTDYMVYIWDNWMLGEKHVVFFPQDLEGNWREMQRRRKAQI
jgi:hypothetical protein